MWVCHWKWKATVKFQPAPQLRTGPATFWGWLQGANIFKQPTTEQDVAIPDPGTSMANFKIFLSCQNKSEQIFFLTIFIKKVFTYFTVKCIKMPRYTWIYIISNWKKRLTMFFLQ